MSAPSEEAAAAQAPPPASSPQAQAKAAAELRERSLALLAGLRGLPAEFTLFGGCVVASRAGGAASVPLARPHTSRARAHLPPLSVNVSATLLAVDAAQTRVAVGELASGVGVVPNAVLRASDIESILIQIPPP
jgi:Gem-associated protein 7 (Gemin7)